MPRIALDAMGGDHAPAATVAGAWLALEELAPETRIQLVGQDEVVRAEIERQHLCLTDRIELVPATQVIEMTDKPAAAVRGKRDSSMMVGLRMQAAGTSDAFVSAGNTGAQMAASVVVLRLHEGLTRPAIGTLFPTDRGVPLVVLDSGANVDCSPEELVQFARLGAVYASDILGRSNPAIGLLSVGEEAEKGSLAVKEAHQLLLKSGLHFVGNVEGRDLPHGACAHGPLDVVVCDGFTGNVVLKFYEAVAPMIMKLMTRSGVDQQQVAAAMETFDYAQYGGAPLLGVRGVSIICHGKSSPLAIKNALKVASLAVENGMAAHVGRSVRVTPVEDTA